jgi:hypothetical protein
MEAFNSKTATTAKYGYFLIGRCDYPITYLVRISYHACRKSTQNTVFGVDAVDDRIEEAVTSFLSTISSDVNSSQDVDGRRSTALFSEGGVE